MKYLEIIIVEVGHEQKRHLNPSRVQSQFLFYAYNFPSAGHVIYEFFKDIHSAINAGEIINSIDWSPFCVTHRTLFCHAAQQPIHPLLLSHLNFKHNCKTIPITSKIISFSKQELITDLDSMQMQAKKKKQIPIHNYEMHEIVSIVGISNEP